MPMFVWAIFNFPGTTEEDLPLVIGDRIEVLMTDDEFNDGWWEGRNDAGRTGLFPKIYTADTMPPPSTAASSVHGDASEASYVTGAREQIGPTRALSPANATATALATSLASSRAPPGHIDTSAMMYGADRDGTMATQSATNPAARAPEASTQPAMPQSAAASLPSEVEKWTPQQVSQHFHEQGVGDDIAAKFAQHEVTGDILLAMHHEDLKEIDIMAFGKRFEIMREIDNLKHRTEASVLNPIEPLTPGGNVGLGLSPLTGPATQRRGSRVLPTHSATGAVLQDRSSSSTMGDYANMTNALLEPVENSALLSVAEEARTTNEQMRQPSLGSFDDSAPAPVIPTDAVAARNISPQRGHRKSMSTSSAALMGAEPITGRRSPDKGHGRSWSQDTVKMPSSHKKTHSGNLSSVREGRGGSLGGSTDSGGPQSPPSTLGSPMSNGVQLSPSTGQPKSGGFAGAKRMLLGQRKQKWQPNAVSQNLENVAAHEASKDANYAGFMRKRSDRAYNWKLKYFVLRGTRLAIYDTDKDGQEKGLIDINSYRVIPIDDILFYSPNKFTFKLVPPAPGATRSLNFTPPKTHYFCTESRDQLRDWMAAFTKATIGRDWSTPVISSCTTKTISLREAQEQRLAQQQRQQAELETSPLMPTSAGSSAANGSNGAGFGGPTDGLVIDGLGGASLGAGAGVGAGGGGGGYAASPTFDDRPTASAGEVLRKLDPALDFGDVHEMPIAQRPTSVPSGRKPLVSPIEDPEANPLTSPSQRSYQEAGRPANGLANGTAAGVGGMNGAQSTSPNIGAGEYGKSMPPPSTTPTTAAAAAGPGAGAAGAGGVGGGAGGGAVPGLSSATSSATPIAEQFRKVPSDSSLRRAVMTASRDR